MQDNCYLFPDKATWDNALGNRTKGQIDYVEVAAPPKLTRTVQVFDDILPTTIRLGYRVNILANDRIDLSSIQLYRVVPLTRIVVWFL